MKGFNYGYNRVAREVYLYNGIFHTGKEVFELKQDPYLTGHLDSQWLTYEMRYSD